jgi:hypothetical protein
MVVNRSFFFQEPLREKFLRIVSNLQFTGQKGARVHIGSSGWKEFSSFPRLAEWIIYDVSYSRVLLFFPVEWVKRTFYVNHSVFSHLDLSSLISRYWVTIDCGRGTTSTIPWIVIVNRSNAMEGAIGEEGRW